MKDLHNHLLFSIDDGPKFVDESIFLLQKMEEKGFDEIILTPHYYEGCNYIANNFIKQKLYNILKEEIKKANINIKIHLGNEIFISDDIIKNINGNKILPLGNSKYLLVEFPMNVYYPIFDKMIDDLINNGFIPIIAHPERYNFYQLRPFKILSLADKGVLFQGNIGAIIGLYGSSAKKTFRKLLKEGIYSFLSTDLHNNQVILNDLDNIKKKIIKIIGADEFNNLTNVNITHVINNENIKKELV